MGRRSLSHSLLSLFVSMLVSATASAEGLEAASSELEPSAAVQEQSDILATAFGYQNDESSTVLVKTFDLKTGALVSEASFTLPGVEETSLSDGASPARILAGGARVAAQGADMKLTLRVYDAQSGRYLHEVTLNVAGDVEAGVLPTPVLGPGPKRPMARRAGLSVESPKDEAPMFLIRAVDPSDERVVWHTEFEPTGSAIGNLERIRYRLLPRETPIVKDQKYDFQVRMYDHRTGEMIWDNASSLLVKPAGSPSREDETLGKVLPVWPSEASDEAAAELI